MEEYSLQHKKAWEFDAYDFWVRTGGTPQERAAKDKVNPRKMLKQFANYFDHFEGVKVANICGSCGKKAIPLALLGAKVTVFDISEANKKYAVETAEAAGVKIDYEVCDIMEINMDEYAGSFDVVFMEGGILHYFHDINAFMSVMNGLLKSGGKMICSDFHPFTKISDILGLQQPTMSYFSTEVFEGEMAHARFFNEEERKKVPKCKYRKYTISEIINASIRAGFTLERFDEQPSWNNPNLPGEFAAIGIK